MIPIVIGNSTYRGRGIGRRVIKLLIDRARTLGWCQLTVNRVFGYNARSQQMFEGLGFKCVEEYTDDDGRACCRYTLKL